MIQLVDQMLEQMLRTGVPLSRDVDVSFATPDRKWGASVTNPTVNLFLWEIRRDAERSQAGHVVGIDEQGARFRRRPNPAVSFRYLATSWAAEHRDEHQLLGAVLRCVLRSEVVDGAFIPPVLGDVGDVTLELAPGDPKNKDFWNSLDGQLKPGLDLTLTMDVPLDVDLPLGPEITEAGVSVNLEPDGISVPEPAAPTRDIRRSRIRRGREIVTSATEGPEQS